jgi:CO/xanthine dehydrogenase FAD-binding subunit
MNHFKILEPECMSEAFSLYEQHADAGCMFLSGGTDIVPLLRKEVVSSAFLIDLRKLGLDAITETPDGVEIGAACTLKKICASRLISYYYPAMCLAASSIGCVQTRGLATLGGNLCSALPSNDTAPAALIHSAKLIAESVDGIRIIEADNFFAGPRKSILLPGEILTKIILPTRKRDTISHFIKFGRRRALTLAIVNEAISAVVRDWRLSEVRLAVGACAPTPLRLYVVEEYLENRRFDDIDEKTVGALTRVALSPIDDIRASAEYRKVLASSLVCKSLRQITGRSDPDDIVVGGRV